MEPHQPFSTASQSPSAVDDSAKPSRGSTIKNTAEFAGEFRAEGLVGSLDVFVHQARDIQNICIYHKQDVYARLCLTSDPDVTVSTQIINGGGRNPIFNQNLRLGVRTVESSLKCEIWMLSKVKNYLEDQLLGFTLVPLADVLVADGKLAQEFSLSSTDLFHSPAGFIQLSLSYAGASPDIMALSAAPKLVISKCSLPDADRENKITSEYQKLEFPDLMVANENHMMVSEYFGIHMEPQGSETTDICSSEEAGIRLVESFSAINSEDSAGIPKNETPVSSGGSTSESTSRAFSTSTARPSPKDASAGIAEGEANSPAVKRPSIVSINMEPPDAAAVQQQDIVEIYMKSMQQFTESLANMKLLPMDVDSATPRSGNGSSDEQPQASKSAGSRVFYGSRAFF